MNKKSVITSMVLAVVSLTIHAQVKLPANAKPSVPVKAPAIKNAPAVNLIRSQTITLTPQVISDLFPTEIMHGDNEFTKGDELTIDVSVSFFGDNGRDSVLYAKVFLHAKELGGDQSEVRKTWNIPVYTAPSGYVIKSLTADQRTLAFSFYSHDFDHHAIDKYGSCYTFLYDLSRSSLGFDLDHRMVTDFKLTTRNNYGPDFSSSEGGISCGFAIRSLKFKPFLVTIEKK